MFDKYLNMKPLFTVKPGESVYSFYSRGKPVNVAQRSAFSESELDKMLAHISQRDIAAQVKALNPGEEIKTKSGLSLRKLSDEAKKEVLNFYKSADSIREMIADLRSKADTTVMNDTSFESSLISDKKR